MCTIALHDSSLWMTLRIPIISLSEQLTRATPTSNQLWIKETLSDFGIESSLFKDRTSDKFMIITQSNFETCSVLGTSRVCNIRRAKFSESSPFIAPIDIGHNRIMILSNSSEPSILTINCEGKTRLANITHNSILQLPSNCTARSKKVEVDYRKLDEQVTTAMDIYEIKEISIKKYTNQRSTALK